METIEEGKSVNIGELVRYMKWLEQNLYRTSKRNFILEVSQAVWIFSLAILLTTLCFGGDHVC